MKTSTPYILLLTTILGKTMYEYMKTKELGLKKDILVAKEEIRNREKEDEKKNAWTKWNVF